MRRPMSPDRRGLRAFVFVTFALTVALSPALAVADAASCEAAKWKGVARALGTTLRCRAMAVAVLATPSPLCGEKADSALAAALAGAQDGGGCASSGEGPDVTASLHAFDEDLLALLSTAPEGARCSSAKIRTTAARALKEIRCRRTAASAAVAVDPACHARAQARLVRNFDMRDRSGRCSTTGDASEAESLVSAFLAFVASRLDGSNPTSAPSGLTAVIDGADVELTWTSAHPGSGLPESRVLRRLGTAPTDPEDPLASVVFEGAADAAVDAVTELLPDTTAVPRTYHYAVYACDEHGVCETAGSHTTLVPTLVQVLGAGGYTIHWRHASADVCSDQVSLGTAAETSSPDWWKSCDANCGTATARQLSAAGRTESAAIGAAFTARGIPVGRVVSSEFCRNVETAALMDFGPTIEESQALTFFVYSEATRCAQTFAMLAETPAPGTNTALIGHAGNTCSPLSSLAWAEAAVYKPDGLGGSTFIERVLAGAWLSLP
jgi:phosphohistidine phosphatase SixA